MSLTVDIRKRLGAFALDVRLEAGEEVLALLGASGCGKSLTLKCVAGVAKPDRGRVALDGQTLYDSAARVNLSPQQRRTGLMFQNYALFPNMTVLGNLRAGARRAGGGEASQQAVRDAMDVFGLSALADRYPRQLSGGEQQRVALARILVSGPRILLLDEPFSALDSHLRFRLEGELREIIRRFGRTVVLVSHDRDEVYRLADSVAIMENGAITALGPKKDVFQNPVTRGGAALTGCKNLSRARAIGPGRVMALDWGVALSLPEGAAAPEFVGVRMHDIRPGDGANACRFRVVREVENPFSYTVMLAPEGAECAVPIGWELDKERWRALRADTVVASLPPGAILCLRA